MNTKVAYYFDLAGKVAMGGDLVRNFWVGSVGLRKDGVMVSARNGAVFSTSLHNYQTIPTAHSEVRTSRKLDKGSVVYVARVSKINGGKTLDGGMLYTTSRPCRMCRLFMISRGVDKVFYTIDPYSYGVIDLKTMREQEFERQHH